MTVEIYPISISASILWKSGRLKFVPVYVDFVKVCVELVFREKCGVCTSFVLLDIVAVKKSVFADFVFLLFCDFEHWIVLLAFKRVFDAVLRDVLFHNHIPFVFQNSL